MVDVLDDDDVAAVAVGGARDDVPSVSAGAFVDVVREDLLGAVVVVVFGVVHHNCRLCKRKNLFNHLFQPKR